MPTANKKKKTTSVKWTESHRAVAHLMEEELQGLIDYLRTLHYLAIALIVSSVIALVYSLRVLFENGQHAVVAFLVIIITSVSVILLSLLALRPWVLPRFLLPMDLAEVDLKQLIGLFSSPTEYLTLLRGHIQALTESFLLPKLHRLRHAITILIFGIATATLLAIALP